MAFHPQSLFLALAGLHLLDDQREISGTSVVAVMGELGITNSAARSVLQRLTVKGFVDRRHEGRKTYYSLSDSGRGIMAEGWKKIFAEGNPGSWDGLWTFVRVQVPEKKRSLRRVVSSRLSWSGFAQLDGGIWVSPGQHDVLAVLGEEHFEISPLVIYGRPCPPTDDAALVRAFDLDEVAESYRRFGQKWSACCDSQLSPTAAVVARIELHHDWLALIRADPQLPVALLPENWPGSREELRFRRIDVILRESEAPAINDFYSGCWK